MSFLLQLERGIEQWVRRFGVAVLQLSLGVMFVWVGGLRLIGEIRTNNVFRAAFPELDVSFVAGVVGVFEVLIGLAILLPLLPLKSWFENMLVRSAFLLIFSQLAGIIVLLFTSSVSVFHPVPPYLTVVGEFIVRMIVFLVAALVVVGHIRIHNAPESAPAAGTADTPHVNA